MGAPGAGQHACDMPLDYPPSTRAAAAANPRAGQVVLVVAAAPAEERPFADPRDADRAASLVADPVRWGDAHLLCWIVLPTEIRLLVRCGGDPLEASLRELWGVLFPDVAPRLPAARTHVLGREDDVLAIANHTVRQAVRAGLATGLDDYRWWGASWRKRPP
jgi:hypothetical protein